MANLPHSRILVPARWTHEGTERTDVAEFKLGKGPCGLTVTELYWEVGEGCLYVWQRHSDGPDKRFVYPLAQLTGRVEATAA